MWTDEIRWITINTFLALIPVVAAYVVQLLVHRSTGNVLARIGAILVGLIWLSFLPNTCYLLTEWRHFLDTVGYTNLYARWQGSSWLAMKLMTYTLFYICFSGLGILTFALAIRPIAGLAREKGLTLWVWGIPLFLLNSIGVYLGLIRRFNSWDLIARPGDIWAATVGILNRQTLATLVIIFAAFLWLVYLAMDIWLDGLSLRRSCSRNE